jgi:hypothetical protein
MIRRTKLTRRSALRGLGATIALPWLEAMTPRMASAAPSEFSAWTTSRLEKPVPRTICCYVPNGVNINQWVPSDPGSDYVLSPTLEVLEPYRDSFTVISGLGHPNARGGHAGADTWLTGADLQAVSGREYTNSVSADQLMAGVVGLDTRFSSIEMADNSGTGSAGHSTTLAFDRNGVPLPAENSPRRQFDRLFVSDTNAARDVVMRRYAEQRSVLDAVMGEANSLMNQLGQADRERLDQYLSSVRGTESRLTRLEAWVDREKPQVDADDLQLQSLPGNAHDREMWIDVMLEIAYLAFATDMTRVITFEWAREANGYGGNGEDHHELSHHGGDPDMLEALARIDRFYLSRLARFMGLLETTNEGDGDMLAHTMIMYGSGMNSGQGGDHSPENLPLIVAGGSAWGLKHGRHLAHDAEKHPPLANVLLTLMQSMGMEVERFQDSTGPLEGLI